MNQLRLFHESDHPEPDCWLSGTPDRPDKEPIDWIYYNGIPKPVVQEAMAEVIDITPYLFPDAA